LSDTRRYVSPKRQAQADATRKAILEAFTEQLSEAGRDRLSPSEAALRAGVSLRTVHFHFPNEASQVAALGEWFDSVLYPQGVVLCAGPDDLPRYFRDIHRMALRHPVSRVLATNKGVWREVRQLRRVKRLAAIRDAVQAIGAPAVATEEATAMLLGLSGADASWPLHDHGLPLARIPDVIAHTVALIVQDLCAKAGARSPRQSSSRHR
jgi:AcrR family transcriptional regulator